MVSFNYTLVNYFSLLFLYLFFFFSNFVSNIDQWGTKTNKSKTSLIIILHKIIFLWVCKRLVNTWKMLINYSKTLVSFSNTLVNYSSFLFLYLFFLLFCIKYWSRGTKANKSNTSLIIILHKIRFLRVCKTLVNFNKILANFSNTLVKWDTWQIPAATVFGMGYVTNSTFLPVLMGKVC